MNTIKISVVVPVYNIKQYIEKTVKSICSQLYSNIEIILVDDGSTDGCSEVLDKLATEDSRIKVIHKDNGGVTSARVAGIKVASGEWIGFVDGDDYIEPKMYEMLLENALESNADISHCGYQMVFPSRVDYYYNTNRIVKQNNEQGLYDLLTGYFVEPGLWNKLYKASIVNDIINSGLIDTSIKINEDLLMNYYFFKASNCSVYQDICPYHYMLRVNSAATSGVNRNKLYDPINVQKTILEDVKDNKKLSSIIYGRLASLYINGASMKNPNKERYIDEYIKMCREELKNIKEPFYDSARSKSLLIRYKLCLLSPMLYRCFHKAYSKLKGTDNRYEVK